MLNAKIKENRKEIKWDDPVLFTSIDFLEAACIRFLSKFNNKNNIWIVESRFTPHPNIYQKSNEPIDVILLGRALFMLLTSGNWPVRKYRLWCLSERFKKLIIHFLKLPENSISVIPRTELFPVSKKPRKLSLNDQEWSFIFAGRISTSKNIKLLLAFISLLQKNMDKKINLFLLGSFDNIPFVYNGEKKRRNYKEEILKFIDNLIWKNPPKIIENLNSQNWFNIECKNPVFISLSTSPFEDFGVSLSQAYSLGWPCVLSDWGGHGGMTGNSIIKIPMNLIAYDNLPDEIIKLQSIGLTRHFNELLLKKHERSIENHNSTPSLPAEIKIQEIDKYRRKF
ncbi:MAG: glycosyltransferase, partial [Halobacteriovoraceae bacterium]|nr:glycosyltransferase [Halobacteriovoraceae bacterium]